LRGAAKDVFYYGFKLGLRTTQYGLIAHHALLEANTCDCRHLPALVEGHQGVVPVDKGFFDPIGWRLGAKEGVPRVRTRPPKRGQHRPEELHLHPWLERFCAQVRKKVETVASLLCSRFSSERIRVHDLWHFEHRFLRKTLAFNLLVTPKSNSEGHPLSWTGLSMTEKESHINWKTMSLQTSFQIAF